jgi:hypothetical protein
MRDANAVLVAIVRAAKEADSGPINFSYALSTALPAEAIPG